MPEVIFKTFQNYFWGLGPKEGGGAGEFVTQKYSHNLNNFSVDTWPKFLFLLFCWISTMRSLVEKKRRIRIFQTGVINEGTLKKRFSTDNNHSQNSFRRAFQSYSLFTWTEMDMGLHSVTKAWASSRKLLEHPAQTHELPPYIYFYDFFFLQKIIHVLGLFRFKIYIFVWGVFRSN